MAESCRTGVRTPCRAQKKNKNRNRNKIKINIPQVAHLHLHHLVFALWAEGPLVGQGIMVISALVARQGDGIAWQLDDLNKTHIQM